MRSVRFAVPSTPRPSRLTPKTQRLKPILTPIRAPTVLGGTRPVRSARLHMCSSRWCHACARATLRAALSCFCARCAMALTHAVMGECGRAGGHACVLPCASVRARARVRSRVRAPTCMRAPLCVRACVRACVRVPPCVRACTCVSFSLCMSVRVRVRARVCLSSCLTAVTCGIYSSARAARCGSRFARVGRRCRVEMPYGQRAVGWPIQSHVSDRRRRRHLRHRRQQQQHPQRCVEEHRRRCAAGLAPGVVGGTRRVLQGY
jgi:hypothetical protein